MAEVSSESLPYFDIPIYHCTQDVHEQEMQHELKKKYLDPLYAANEADEKSLSNAESIFNKEKRFIWRYNEIVGWIRIYARKRHIKGEFYFIKGNVTKRGPKSGIKTFLNKDTLFELAFNKRATSKRIFNKLKTQIEALNKESPLKQRYIDTELLNNLEEVVDWRKLVGFK